MREELEGLTDEEMPDIVELTDDNGKVLKFFHIGTMEHKEKWYCFFQPAEEMEGADDDEVVIFELAGEEGEETLLPIEDEALLEEVYEEFCRVMEEEEAAEEAEDAEGCSCGCGKHNKDGCCKDKN